MNVYAGMYTFHTDVKTVNDEHPLPSKDTDYDIHRRNQRSQADTTSTIPTPAQ